MLTYPCKQYNKHTGDENFRNDKHAISLQDIVLSAITREVTRISQNDQQVISLQDIVTSSAITG